MKVLSEELEKCGVLLAVIGPNWLDARDKDGNRRLDNPNDFVRVEIATALQREIPIIPMLFDGLIPKADQLPEDLKGLALCNALDVRPASFHSDMEKLIGLLKGLGRLKGQIGGGLTPKEEREAARRAISAAEQGDATAQSRLGDFYREGRGGLPQDHDKAARFYRLAAEKGDFHAKFLLEYPRTVPQTRATDGHRKWTAIISTAKRFFMG